MGKFSLSKLRGLKRPILNQDVISLKGATESMLCKSDPALVQGVRSDEPQEALFNHSARVLINRRMREIDVQKARAILESRHEKWKGAGGPL